MCVRSECSFVVGAADAREVSVADAGEVACGTPELLGVFVQTTNLTKGL